MCPGRWTYPDPAHPRPPADHIPHLADSGDELPRAGEWYYLPPSPSYSASFHPPPAGDSRMGTRRAAGAPFSQKGPPLKSCFGQCPRTDEEGPPDPPPAHPPLASQVEVARRGPSTQTPGQRTHGPRTNAGPTPHARARLAEGRAPWGPGRATARDSLSTKAVLGGVKYNTCSVLDSPAPAREIPESQFQIELQLNRFQVLSQESIENHFRNIKF